MKSSRIKVHMDIARRWAEESHAKRLKVGAVLVRDDRTLASGYNGTPSGRDNQCEERFDKLSMLDEIISSEWKTKPEVVHAEMNVIAFAAKNGLATDGATLVITHSPCFDCCKLLLQAGIKEVYYNTEYRDTNGLQLLIESDVIVKGVDV